MNSKEKAKELVDKHLSFNKMYFSTKHKDEDDYIAKQIFNHSKQCAIIAVNELIEHCYEVMKPFWYDVKHEIEQL